MPTAAAMLSRVANVGSRSPRSHIAQYVFVRPAVSAASCCVNPACSRPARSFTIRSACHRFLAIIPVPEKAPARPQCNLPADDRRDRAGERLESAHYPQLIFAPGSDLFFASLVATRTDHVEFRDFVILANDAKERAGLLGGVFATCLLVCKPLLAPRSQLALPRLFRFFSFFRCHFPVRFLRCHVFLPCRRHPTACHSLSGRVVESFAQLCCEYNRQLHPVKQKTGGWENFLEVFSDGRGDGNAPETGGGTDY